MNIFLYSCTAACKLEVDSVTAASSESRPCRLSVLAQFMRRYKPQILVEVMVALVDNHLFSVDDVLNLLEADSYVMHQKMFFELYLMGR